MIKATKKVQVGRSKDMITFFEERDFKFIYNLNIFSPNTTKHHRVQAYWSPAPSDPSNPKLLGYQLKPSGSYFLTE